MQGDVTRRVRRAWGRVCIAAAALAAIGTARASSEPRAATAALRHARPLPRVAAPPAGAKAAKHAERSASPVVLQESPTAPGALVYAPQSAGARGVTVMLHGMCDEPENECPYFAGAVTRGSWLLCPRARLRCNGGGSIWSWQRFEHTVEASVARVASEHPGAIDIERGRTLVGFSLGAIRGMDLAHRSDGRYSAVVLIGAKVHPDARRLRAAGVERLLLAAGDYDMMKWQMAGEARRLVRQGYPAAFMSLGKVGHWFPRDFQQRLAKGLAWAQGDDAAFVPSAPGEVAFRPAPTR